MKKAKRLHALLCVAVLLCSALAGCGSAAVGDQKKQPSWVGHYPDYAAELAKFDDVTADSMTDEQLQQILALITDGEYKIAEVFWFNEVTAVDPEAPRLPMDDTYILYPGDDFTCVQDIRDFIASVYTGGEAYRMLGYIDDTRNTVYDPTKDDISMADAWGARLYYVDYKGKLYYANWASGPLMPYDYHPEKATIKERFTKQSSIQFILPSTLGVDNSEEDLCGSLIKTRDGWRLETWYV